MKTNQKNVKKTGTKTGKTGKTGANAKKTKKTGINFLGKLEKQEESAVIRPPRSRHEELSRELIDSEAELRKKLEGYYSDLADEGEDLRSEDSELHRKIEDEIDSLKVTSSNLRRSYIDTALLADELESRFRDVKKSVKKRRILKSAPANSVIDYLESESNHFARGLNIYKLLLICFAGSFAGVVVELFWCLITHGYIESRSGLVYGPFNLLYGAGAVMLTIFLYEYRNHSAIFSFAGGMIVGSVLEYVCSWGQEMLIGSRSWDYSGMPYNLNGRICLLYSVFWGILGVLWIKNIYPRVTKLILKIPNSVGKYITLALLAFFIFNAAVTGVALFRWSERIGGVETTSAFWRIIDARFPDSRMESIFANMKFSGQ